MSGRSMKIGMASTEQRAFTTVCSPANNNQTFLGGSESYFMLLQKIQLLLILFNTFFL
jgi:hypothetical protein